MYPLNLELIEFLLSKHAKDELSNFDQSEYSPDNALTVITRLRKKYSPAQAAVLYDQAILRHRATKKFSNAANMFFTEQALQQATAPEVAQYHASLFERMGETTKVADLGCGIGGDTIAFASKFKVFAVESNPVRHKLAEINIDACGLSEKVDLQCADWTSMTLPVNAAYIDPARRVSTSNDHQKRVYHLDQMVPPIAVILPLQKTIQKLAVKVAPGVSHREIPCDAEVSFISVRGQMKEALLRFGSLRNGASRTALLLPEENMMNSLEPVETLSIREPSEYLYEPDAAIIRAGLVQHVGTRYNLAQLDGEIAYLTGDSEIVSPFIRSWYVHRSGSFLLKKLKRWLNELEVGRIIIKKRGSPIDVDKFSKQIKTNRDGAEFTVFLTRVDDKPWMIVGTPL